MFVEFFEVGLIVRKDMAWKLDLSISLFVSGPNENFESFKLQMTEVKLFNIQNRHSLLLFQLFMEISWFVNSSLILNVKLSVLQLCLNLFYALFGVSIMHINEVGFIVVWNGRVERLLMELSLAGLTPKRKTQLSY